MHTQDAKPIAIPLPDLAGGAFFCLLGMGWLLVNHAAPLQALALAAVTALCFWAPLRLLDLLHHGRWRANGILALASLRHAQPAPAAADTGAMPVLER